MPIYVYKCEENHTTEIFQGVNTKPLEVCPHCGKKTKKIISRTSFKFKANQGKNEYTE